MKFNINYRVKVRLNDVGRAHLQKIEQSWRLAPASISREESDGWSTWQLWELMSLFGPIIYMGCNVPFETEIEIPEGQG